MLALSNASKAGAILFVGGVQYGIFLIVAEAVSPSYSVSTNAISDLGKIFPNSVPIFNSSIAIFGLLVLLSAYYVQKAFRWKPATVLGAITGIGLIGVASFPEGSPYQLHGLFSLITFLFAGLDAVVAARFQFKPMFYFSIFLGIFTLAATVLYVGGENLGLGQGGMERMVVYPVLLWVIGFGGHLMSMSDHPVT